MSQNPYANSNPDGVQALWEACHNGMEKRWDPVLADGMTWDEFDERSKTMSMSAYMNYSTRQAPMFSKREDQIIADAFGEKFAQDLRDIHEGRYDIQPRQSRIGKFITKILSRD